MTELEIRVLGHFWAGSNGQPFTNLTAQKAKALLAYLALNGDQPHSRVALAELLWSDQSAENATHSLRQTLSHLRKVIPDFKTHFTSNRTTITLHTTALRVDALRFLDGLESDPEHAAQLYAGALLADFFVSDAGGFELWLLGERERLQMLALGCFEQLADAAMATRDYAKAQSYLKQIVAIDAWHEPAQRTLMLAYARSGAWHDALAQYERCVAALRDGLNVAPMPETQQLAERIRLARGQVRHNLVGDEGGFFGRKTELTTLTTALTSHRLVTLQGQGGSGKTRLAQAYAQQAINDYLNGVWFVPLATVTDGDQLPQAIAAALSLQLPDNAQLEQKLFEQLAQRELLLILDNFESVQGGATVVARLLKATRDVTILVTSRERLDLHAEQRIRLGGLQAQSAALQLFTTRAQQRDPNFVLENVVDAVAEICQMVGGLPLGIELAAAQVDLLSCDELVVEIGRNHDILQADWQDKPARHHSLRAAFNQSWQRLDADAQQLLRRLSVFRGGFSRAAADVVTGGNLRLLNTLLARSLLQRVSREPLRFDLHPVVRHYAGEKVRDKPRIAQQHATYFLELATLTDEAAFSAESLTPDSTNIAHAWQHAVTTHNIALLQPAIIGLSRFYIAKSWFRAGRELFAWAVAELAPFFDEPRQTREQEFWGRLLAYRAGLSLYLGEVTDALESAENAVTTFTPLDAQEDFAHAYNMLGIAQMYAGQFADSRTSLEACVTIYRQLGLRGKLVSPLVNLGSLLHRLGDNAASRRIVEEGLTICRAQNDKRGMVHLLNNLAGLVMIEGDLPTAKSYYAECLELSIELNNRIVEASARLNLGEIILRGDSADRQQAADYFTTAHAIAVETGDLQRQCRADKLSADLARQQGQLDQAWQLLQQGLQQAWQTQQMHSTFELLLGFAGWFESADDPSQSQQLYHLIATHPAAPELYRTQARDRLTTTITDITTPDLDAIVSHLLTQTIASLAPQK